MAKMYGGIEPDYFDIAAIYEIKFPPSIWSELTEKQKELAKEKGHSELKLKDEVQDYKFKDKVRSNPVRGELDPNDLSNLDNNALFYGAPRTGKSIMVEKMAYEIDKYPLVVIQGSTLTPKKPDNDIGATLLIKFIYTVSDITHKLVEDFGFERDEKDGEVRYILFLDECDQICTTHLLPPKDASSQLTFLKECMGSDSKEEEKFMQYATDAGINAQFPQRKFIDKNPEAEYEPEEDEKKKPEELKDSSQLDNFDGKFVNPRDPKIEEVIKESSVLAANHISKTIDRRIGYCAKKAHDAYSKHSKRQKERLALKGKSLEEAREDNKKAREEEKKTRDELEEQERKNKELEKELEQARNKVNDPSLSEEERAK
ncbi:16283_t:CDS:2 [Funneliformis geosporum]|uniref:16283_t:CDS:1 n=1 Tax=Funneliformis geosporum TaxID=1117311 RepID=A0A9W4X0G6_9GLOM|nr:16283_t:CDS:2 [Funneliformis geosporum]